MYMYVCLLSKYYLLLVCDEHSLLVLLVPAGSRVGSPLSPDHPLAHAGVVQGVVAEPVGEQAAGQAKVGAVAGGVGGGHVGAEVPRAHAQVGVEVA